MKFIDSYKKLCTEFYDLDKPFAQPESFNFYLNEAQKSNHPVLEPMCGSGRFLIPLLEHGINIDGMDASSEMLESLKKKCVSKNLDPVIYHQCLQNMTIKKKFGLVIIPSGSFGLITDDKDVMDSLKSIYSVLYPGGKLILEIETPCKSDLRGMINRREVVNSENSKIEFFSRSEFDKKQNILTTDYIYRKYKMDKLTEQETETISIRNYKADEFTALLIKAGFKQILSLIPYSDKAATDEDENILFSCIKIK
ncbi:MAG: class I SAM-dependent methyltransferase [Ignavibacteriae bacterium]|nr:class I SAM-dependent methyltransferase [Ignavibacteriota bacterium]